MQWHYVYDWTLDQVFEFFLQSGSEKVEISVIKMIMFSQLENVTFD